MMRETALDIANLATELVAFSPVALKLCDLIDDKTSSANSISEVISQDPVLTTKLLKLANSPFCGFSQDIGGIDEAVSRIGTTEVFHMALSVSASETFDGIPETLITMNDFWSHSVLCAYAAQELAQTFKLKKTGVIYAAGLLHDIGQLILFANRPDESTKVLERCVGNYDELDQCSVEREVFGFTHAEIGKELARMWHFPEMLQETIANHHQPHLSKKYSRESLIINMSNILAVLIEVQSHDLNDAPYMDISVKQAFEKNLKDVSSICKRIEGKFLENKSIVLEAMN